MRHPGHRCAGSGAMTLSFERSRRLERKRERDRKRWLTVEEGAMKVAMYSHETGWGSTDWDDKSPEERFDEWLHRQGYDSGGAVVLGGEGRVRVTAHTPAWNDPEGFDDMPVLLVIEGLQRHSESLVLVQDLPSYLGLLSILAPIVQSHYAT